jgi:integrase/recombinase XerC
MHSIIIKYKEIYELTINKDISNVFLTNQREAPYPNFVYRTIKEYLKKVTSQTGIGPHTLRHSFATHLLNNGAELNVIKEMLGHSSLAATQVYTNSSIERLKQIHKISHPKS